MTVTAPVGAAVEVQDVIAVRGDLSAADWVAAAGRVGRPVVNVADARAAVAAALAEWGGRFVPDGTAAGLVEFDFHGPCGEPLPRLLDAVAALCSEGVTLEFHLTFDDPDDDFSGWWIVRGGVMRDEDDTA